jgi:hypothetical protein
MDNYQLLPLVLAESRNGGDVSGERALKRSLSDDEMSEEVHESKRRLEKMLELEMQARQMLETNYRQLKGRIHDAAVASLAPLHIKPINRYACNTSHTSVKLVG